MSSLSLAFSRPRGNLVKTEFNGLLEMIPGKSQLKVCCERDYGCNPGSVRDSRVKVDYWESKLGLPDYLSYKAPLINGIDGPRPDKSLNSYLGDAVAFGGASSRQLESTYVPPAATKFTVAFVTANSRFDIATAALFGVNDTNWCGVQNFSGFQVFGGDFLTQTSTGAIHGPYGVPVAQVPVSLTKAHLIQVEWSPDVALPNGGAWLNGVIFTGSADKWVDAGPIDYIRIGGGEYVHKAIYIFEGAVNPTDLFNWTKARFPEITF